MILSLFSCENNSQQTDTEKEESETKIEIKGDSGEVKIGEDGISINETPFIDLYRKNLDVVKKNNRTK